MHRSRVRDGNVGAAVGDTVLMVAIYDHVVDLGGSRRVTAWVPDCFWLGSVEVRTPKLLFGVIRVYAKFKVYSFVYSFIRMRL